MALIFCEGFELPINAAQYNDLPMHLSTGGLGGISTNVLQPAGGTGNGFRSLELGFPESRWRINLQNEARKKQGILSFLYRMAVEVNPITTPGHTLCAVRQDGAAIAQVRLVSYNSSTEIITLELHAGGSQIDTFEIPYDNSWQRIALVWDGTGANITAAVYIDGTLMASGTGGSTLADEEIDNIFFFRIMPGPRFFDSVTLWDDPVDDLTNAISAHWVDALVCNSPAVAVTGDWDSFFNTTSPSGNISARLADNNPVGTGAKTVVPNSPLDLEFAPMAYTPDQIFGIQPVIVTMASTALPNMILEVESNSTVGTTLTRAIPVRDAFVNMHSEDPDTGAPWTPAGVTNAIVRIMSN